MAQPLVQMRCSNCGSDVPITSPGTVTVTCSHCGALCLRGDVDLQTLGEVALPAPLASRFQIGTEGVYDGRRFVVRGQIQLDHGAGLWNEWAAETDEGWLWIAEAQGEVQLYEEVEGADVPDRSLLPEIDTASGEFVMDGGAKAWRAGDRVPVAGKRWTIREMGRGTVVTFKGELPIRMKPGTRTTYIDVVRGATRVGTLDFTRGGPPEFLAGHVLDPGALQIDPATQPDSRPDSIAATTVTCLHCGGTIEVQDADKALTLGCQHCGTILQRDNHMEAYHAAEVVEKMKSVPAIPLGSQGVLMGESVTALGYLRRGVWADGRFYPWSEYLLRTDGGAYRWLVESSGHWIYSTPVPPTRFKYRGSSVSLGADNAKAFSEGQAVVDTVLGEFYWQVKVGESVDTKDFVHPKSGRMVSMESSPTEMASSLGYHVEPESVEAAFPGAKLPRRSGVGPIQPSPFKPGAVWKVCLLMLVLLTGSCVGIRVIKSPLAVHSQTFGPAATVPGQELVQFSDPFVIILDGENLKVTVSSSRLSQGYLEVLGALVNEDTGEVTTFGTAVQRYSGSSGGESWSEGRRTASVLLGDVPKGSYRLRIASVPYDKAAGAAFTVELQSRTSRVAWYVLAFLVLLIYPIIVGLRAAAFEAKRWSTSDFT